MYRDVDLSHLFWLALRAGFVFFTTTVLYVARRIGGAKAPETDTSEQLPRKI
jgi:hypothetical protein